MSEQNLNQKLTVPVLDDRTFAQLVQEAADLLPQYAPQWTDHNGHDPGMTLLELFSWLAEMQLFALDQVSDAHLLKYLKLLDAAPLPAKAAEVMLTWSAQSLTSIAAGTQVTNSDDWDAPVFETSEPLDVLPWSINKVMAYFDYRYTDVTGFNRKEENYYPPFGTNPQQGDALYIGFQADEAPLSAAGKQLNLGIHLYEKDLPPEGKHGLEPWADVGEIYITPQVRWEYWNGSLWAGLTVITTALDRLTLSRSGIVSLLVPPDIAVSQAGDLPALGGNYLWIRCVVEKGGYELYPRIDRILVNQVPAQQGQTVATESPGAGSGLPGQTYTISAAPVAAGTQTVTITPQGGDPQEWVPVPDFDASGPTARHYVVKPQAGIFCFGNGIEGAVPSKGALIQFNYRSSGNSEGNVPAAFLNKTTLTGPTVSNPYAASGGTEAQSIDAAFAGFKADLDVPYTAVTASDYESIALATPGLRTARARSVIENRDQPNKVSLVVVPYSFSAVPTPSDGFKRTVCEHLDRHRLITTDLHVQGPNYVKVSVLGDIIIHDGYLPARVEAAAKKALNQFLSPLKRAQGDNEWPFGRPVYLSEIYELLDGVDGADCVRELSLRAEGPGFNYKNGNIEIGKLSLVYAGDHHLTVLTANQPCQVKQNEFYY